MLAIAVGVTIIMTKFHSQWLAVEIEDMATRSRIGAISVQYRKFAPRNPIGTKNWYKKIKTTAATCADKLLFGKDVATARANIQLPIPVAMNQL